MPTGRCPRCALRARWATRRCPPTASPRSGAAARPRSSPVSAGARSRVSRPSTRWPPAAGSACRTSSPARGDSHPPPCASSRRPGPPRCRAPCAGALPASGTPPASASRRRPTPACPAPSRLPGRARSCWRYRRAGAPGEVRPWPGRRSRRWPRPRGPRCRRPEPGCRASGRGRRAPGCCSPRAGRSGPAGSGCPQRSQLRAAGSSSRPTLAPGMTAVVKWTVMRPEPRPGLQGF